MHDTGSRHNLVSWALFAFVCLIPCLALAGNEAPVVSTSEVQVRVVLPDGEPAVGVEFRYCNAYLQEGAGFQLDQPSAVSDENGFVRVTLPALEPLCLQFELSGFAPLFHRPGLFKAGQKHTLSTLSLKASRSVTIRVLDETGSGVAGLLVGDQGLTDVSGECEYFYSADYRAFRNSFKHLINSAIGKSAEVAAGAQLTITGSHVEIKVPGRAYYGTVSYGDGTPAGGAKISLKGRDPEDYDASTRPDGGFVLLSEVEPPFEIEVRYGSYATRQTISHSTAPAELQIGRGEDVSVIVTDPSSYAPGIDVHAWLRRVDASDGDPLLHGGRVRGSKIPFRNIAPGEYELHYGLVYKEKKQSISVVSDAENRVAVTVGPRPQATYTLRVLRPDGVAATKAVVRFEQGTLCRHLAVNAEGVVSIHALLSKDDPPTAECVVYERGFLAQRVKLQSLTQDVTLLPARSSEVRVIDTAGQPVQLQSVVCVPIVFRDVSVCGWPLYMEGEENSMPPQRREDVELQDAANGKLLVSGLSATGRYDLFIDLHDGQTFKREVSFESGSVEVVLPVAQRSCIRLMAAGEPLRDTFVRIYAIRYDDRFRFENEELTTDGDGWLCFDLRQPVKLNVATHLRGKGEVLLDLGERVTVELE